MQLAIALYNNNVDDEDELEFHKGDILTVLIENPNGFDGWWLCKHKDKCGLCPGNRLKLIENNESSPIKINTFIDSRLSTASMYDSLSNHDYDNPNQSDFISNLKTIESSSRSSGIYSTNDFQLSSSSSSSSSDFYPTIIHKSLSSIDLNQLEKTFQKLSIHSLIIDKYRQLISYKNIETIFDLFLNECQLFLQNYGCLLDRYTYKLIKENLLYEFKEKKNKLQLSTKILQLIDLKLKEKISSSNLISNDVFKKLHLEPIKEILPNKTLIVSHSSTQIHPQQSHTQMKTSKTCHSDFSTYNKFNDFDHTSSINPLIKCYYRHINEQIDLILKRYSYLLENDNKISLLIIDGKRLVVAGHKLIFVLETLYEHLQQIQTSLMYLTTQLCEALTNLIQLLKQFSQQNSKNIQKLIIHFQDNIKIIMNIVKKIKQECSLV